MGPMTHTTRLKKHPETFRRLTGITVEKFDEILKLFFDGTEQPTNRPKKGQRKWYSGKKKRHTIKHQVAVVRKKKKTGRGRQKRKVRIAAVSKRSCSRTSPASTI